MSNIKIVFKYNIIILLATLDNDIKKHETLGQSLLKDKNIPIIEHVTMI